MKITCEVTDPMGLHARPASRLAQYATGLTSEVALKTKGASLNPKSALELLAASLPCGTVLEFELKGEAAREEACELEDFCKKNL